MEGRGKKEGRGPTQMVEPGLPVTLLRYCLSLILIVSHRLLTCDLTKICFNTDVNFTMC